MVYFICGETDMTIFELSLINLIHRKARDKSWWIFSSIDDLKRYWIKNSIRLDTSSRFFAISVNDQELNIECFDYLSENPNIDVDSILISSSNLENVYEELFFGQ